MHSTSLAHPSTGTRSAQSSPRSNVDALSQPGDNAAALQVFAYGDSNGDCSVAAAQNTFTVIDGTLAMEKGFTTAACTTKVRVQLSSLVKWCYTVIKSWYL